MAPRGRSCPGQCFHRQNRLGNARVKPACLAFRHYWPDISPRGVGGGRATRQPGQVRKEAALTSTDRVARQPPTQFLCDRSKGEGAAARMNEAPKNIAAGKSAEGA